jgi:hypothetical protein
MTVDVSSISELPRGPAVYAMYGGESVGQGWVAYVGIAGNLRGRLDQHFVKRDSSVVTGTSAVGVNIEHVRIVEWWEHERFRDDDQRHAAELVAFEVLNPALRSRGRPRQAALAYLHDKAFVDDVRAVLKAAPAGRLVLPRLADLAHTVADLEQRVSALERKSRERRGS